MLMQIAWRNLWRNRRRTLLTVAAVAGGLAGMLAMNAMMQAMGDRMLEALIGSSGGHVQIHREGYRTDQQFTLTIPDADKVLQVVRRHTQVVGATGRIYGFAHTSFVRGDDETVRSGGGEEVGAPVVALFGVDPEHELRVTDMNERVIEGRWIRAETEVVIGAALARRRGIRIGDAMLPTAVASTGAMQGPWAVSDQVPRVVGIIRTGVDEIDSRMVIVTITYLAQLVRLEGQAHEIAIRAQNSAEEQLSVLVEALRLEVAEMRSQSNLVEQLPTTQPLRIGKESADGVPPGSEAQSVRLIGVGIDEGSDVHSPEGLAAGRFLQRAEDILLPNALGKRLHITVGERVSIAVPVDCGDHVTAEDCPPSSESFVVAGLFQSESPELAEVGFVAQTVVSDNIVALAPQIAGRLEGRQGENVQALIGQLRGRRNARDEIMAWNELNPSLEEMLVMLETAPLIFYIIIYFAVVIGIANTMLMATFERMREFGIMRAIGMPPLRVVSMVVTESALLSLVGVAVGLAIGLPLVFYWQFFGLDTGVFMQGESYNVAGVNFDPVLWPTTSVFDVVQASLAVSIMTTLAGLWPAVKAARLQPTEALRHE